VASRAPFARQTPKGNPANDGDTAPYPGNPILKKMNFNPIPAIA
jgi:hypothetical protein